VGVCCMQGKRETMEDAHSVVLTMEEHPEWGFFGVFDGHEGSDTAVFCSEYLWKEIDKCEVLSEESIKDKFMEFDDILGQRGSGSTACSVMVNKNKLEDGYPIVVMNLGDSRAFIGQKNSKEFRVLTQDHKPSLPEEAARIEKAGAQVYRNRVNSSLAVSRAFGDSQYKDTKDLAKHEQKVIALPDVTLSYLKEDEFIFICCDGIFESFSNESTFEFLHNKLSTNNDMAVVLSELVTSVLKGGSRDNMSTMLIQLTDGTDYVREDEFLLGTYYIGGNDSYQIGFRLDCEKHGLKWEEVEHTVIRSSEQDSDLTLSARSLPTIAVDKNLISLKAQPRPGISKSSRNLVVSPSLLASTTSEDNSNNNSPISTEKKEPSPSSSSENKISPNNSLSVESTPKEKIGLGRFLLSKSQKKDKKNGKSKTTVISGRPKK